jgi:hypothetical protein
MGRKIGLLARAIADGQTAGSWNTSLVETSVMQDSAKPLRTILTSEFWPASCLRNYCT